MKIKYMAVMVSCLLLSSFTTPVMGWGGNGGGCSGNRPSLCHNCEGGVWVDQCDPDNCEDCNLNGECESRCDPVCEYCEYDPEGSVCDLKPTSECGLNHPECEDTDCAECVNCQCVDNVDLCGGNCCNCVDGYCEPNDNKCPGECHYCWWEDCLCYDDDSKCDPSTSTVSYSTGLSSVVSGIESGINSIPRVTASGWSASASFTAEKGEECCEGTCTDYYWVGGSVDISGSVSVDIPALGWSWEHTWDGYGSIACGLGITVTPTITVDASAGATGYDSECGSCLTLDGSGTGTGTLLVEAGGTIALQSQIGWEWLDNKQFEVSATASVTVSTSAWASGAWQKGSDCCFTGFRTYCYGVAPTTASAAINFTVLSKSFSWPSDTITLIDGVHEHPTYDPPCV